MWGPNPWPRAQGIGDIQPVETRTCMGRTLRIPDSYSVDGVQWDEKLPILVCCNSSLELRTTAKTKNISETLSPRTNIKQLPSNNHQAATLVPRSGWEA